MPGSRVRLIFQIEPPRLTSTPKSADGRRRLKRRPYISNDPKRGEVDKTKYL